MKRPTSRALAPTGRPAAGPERQPQRPLPAKPPRVHKIAPGKWGMATAVNLLAATAQRELETARDPVVLTDQHGNQLFVLTF